MVTNALLLTAALVVVLALLMAVWVLAGPVTASAAAAVALVTVGRGLAVVCGGSQE